MSWEVVDGARERWNELVAADADSAGRLAELREELTELGIVAGERPLCTVLRPHLISEEQLARQARAAGLVYSAATKVRDAVLADQRLHRLHLGSFMDWVGDLVELEPAPVLDPALARLDASLTRGRLHFLELNADSPQGAGHHDSILEFFARLDAFRAFAAEYRVRPLELVPPLLATLRRAWHEWGGSRPLAITVMTGAEDPVLLAGLEVEAARYRARGVAATICDFRDLGFDGGRLRAGGREVELLYRVMPIAQCLEHRDELSPLFAAVRAGAVCMVNPFRSELLGHKALFALMTDPALEFGFDAAERGAVRDHVPWGRRLADGRTTDARGREVDLVEHVLGEREHLVLKPAHEFGGRGVLLGWREDEAGWRRAVEEAIAGDCIVQRRVPLHHAEYPTMEAPGARSSYFEDTDPFLFGGRTGGMLTRLSRDEITNVHAGGSVVASFAVAPRD